MAPDALPDPIAVALTFTAVLDRIGVLYVIGGSFASSVHGEPRSTNDIDVVADLRPEHVAVLAEAIGPEFYVSRSAMQVAIQDETSFNIIHVHGGIKIDVFVAGTDEFNRERLRVREAVHLLSTAEAALYVDTAEHSILRKLEWFRRGGEVSERQWRDVIGMLRVQGDRLDWTRLDHWAAALDVTDLLHRARAEALSGTG